jgi:uncharacterized membrane protein HdeD (DUF308 family)
MDRDPILFDFEEVSHVWRRFLLLGIGLILLGFADLAATWTSTFTSVLALGALLVVGGVMEVFAAKWGRHSSGLLLRLLVGVLHIFVGVILISYPSTTLSILALLVAWLFLTSGLLRTAIAALLRYPAWGWGIFETIAAVILGMLIWINWPGPSLWVIAVFIGSALVVRGWAWVMFALGVRPVSVVDTLFGYARNFW